VQKVDGVDLAFERLDLLHEGVGPLQKRRHLALREPGALPGLAQLPDEQFVFGAVDTFFSQKISLAVGGKVLLLSALIPSRCQFVIISPKRWFAPADIESKRDSISGFAFSPRTR